MKALFAPLFVLFAAAAGTVWASGEFDGDWTVQIIADSGDCQARSVPLRVNGQRVSYEGWFSPSAEGIVTGAGKVNVRFQHREHVVLASGALIGAGGAGRWISPTLQCGGSWQAIRQ